MGSARAALAFLLAAGALGLTAPAFAQDAPTPTPPSTERPIDFRLPPTEDDGRAPGVQGPSDNGLAPLSPGESRANSAPTPTPAPTPTAPRVTPTQPTTVTPPATNRRDTPATAATARPATNETPDAAPTADDTPSDPAPLPTATPDDAPMSAPASAAIPDDEPLAAPAAPTDGDMPLWGWALALLAAGAAGFWYWRRRPVLADEGPPEAVAPAERVADPRPVAPPAAPRATPPPVSRAPAPASPLVTRPAAERRAQVAIAFDVQAIRVVADHVAIAFSLDLTNRGAVDATGMIVRIALNQGSAMTEPVLARFFDGVGGSMLRDDMALAAGASDALSGEVKLPRATIEPLIIGGKPMLVPVMAFDVTYHWDGDADAFGQAAGTFILGRESAAGGSAKLAPLPLDRASYAVERPGARATAVQRSQ